MRKLLSVLALLGAVSLAITPPAPADTREADCSCRYCLANPENRCHYVEGGYAPGCDWYLANFC